MNRSSLVTVLAAVAVLWLGDAAGGGQTRSAREIREDAYRANNLGVALLEQFKFEESAAAFREALRLDPSPNVNGSSLCDA